MRNRSFFIFLGVAVLGASSHALAQAPSVAEVEGQPRYVVRSEAARTSDLTLPADARVLYRRMRMAAYRACYRNHFFLENMDGRSRAAEVACRRQVLDSAVAALDAPSVTALHLRTQEARAFAAQ